MFNPLCFQQTGDEMHFNKITFHFNVRDIKRALPPDQQTHGSFLIGQSKKSPAPRCRQYLHVESKSTVGQAARAIIHNLKWGLAEIMTSLLHSYPCGDLTAKYCEDQEKAELQSYTQERQTSVLDHPVNTRLTPDRRQGAFAVRFDHNEGPELSLNVAYACYTETVDTNVAEREICEFRATKRRMRLRSASHKVSLSLGRVATLHHVTHEDEKEHLSKQYVLLRCKSHLGMPMLKPLFGCFSNLVYTFRRQQIRARTKRRCSDLPRNVYHQATH